MRAQKSTVRSSPTRCPIALLVTSDSLEARLAAGIKDRVEMRDMFDSNLPDTKVLHALCLRSEGENVAVYCIFWETAFANAREFKFS